MNRFEGKVAIVTGGASGIGAATVARLVTEGAKVMIADVNDPASPPEGTRFQRTDVSSQADVEALVEATVVEWGRLDLIVNNAGIGGLARTDESDPADWEKIFAINSTGVYLCSRAAIPHLKETRGSIVNTASISGLVGDYYMGCLQCVEGARWSTSRVLWRSSLVSMACASMRCAPAWWRHRLRERRLPTRRTARTGTA